MRLVDSAFKSIKSGHKDIEIRLNDEKRQLINIGDIIEFTNITTGEKLKVKVIDLHLFKTFSELFEAFDHKRLGITDNADAKSMDLFYSKEEQEKYMALGIEMSLID